MTKPRTLAAILLLSALATPALAQGAGGPDNASPPASGQPETGGQPNTGTPPPPAAPSAPGPTAGGTEPASPRPALVRNPTADVQERLQQLGLYNGDIDGKWGPQTRGAVVEFQRSHGLRPTGTLDVATIARLRQITQNAPPTQDNTAGQQPTPDTGAGGNRAEATPPPARRPPGSSTNPGARTSPGSSTTARATVTVPGLVVPGLGIGNNTFETSPAGPETGAGFGSNAPPSFFGTPLDLSNGYNAAVGRGH